MNSFLTEVKKMVVESGEEGGGRVGRKMWAGNALTLGTFRGRPQLEANLEEEQLEGCGLCPKSRP